MQLSIAACTLALLYFFGNVAGHLHLKVPTPYTGPGPFSDEPLNALGGSPTFPCHGNSEGAAAVTPIKAGDNLRVMFDSFATDHATIMQPYSGPDDPSWTGTSVHGGGSCQFSISYDYPAKSPGTWKTIYTIIGGCPSQWPNNFNQPEKGQHNQCGNSYAGNITTPVLNGCLNQFDIPFPKDMPGGKASFAWTWFNKIGNGEMYMHCAPLDISSESTDTGFYDKLPDMFVANVGGGSCNMEAATSLYNIPNPGQYGAFLQPLDPTHARAGNCPIVSDPPPFASNDLTYLQAHYPANGDVPGPAASGAAPPPAAGGAGASSSTAAAGSPSTTPTVAPSSLTPAAQSTTTSSPSAVYATPADSAGVFHTVPTDGGDTAHPSVTGFLSNGAASPTPQSSTSVAAQPSVSSPAADSPLPPPAAASSSAAPPAAAPAPASAGTTLTSTLPAASTIPASGGGNAGGAAPSEPACTANMYCYDDQHFGLCAYGVALAPMTVAAGMKCENGQYVYAVAPGAGEPTAAVVKRM